MANSRLIIWDFDGVLVDSLKECIIVLKISLEILKNQNNIQVNKKFVQLIMDNFDHELFHKMKKLRPFIINGQDYIWQYLNFKKLSKTYNSYNEYKKDFDKIFDFKKDKIYEEVFYKSRKALQNLLMEDYYKLFSPYEGAFDALRKSIKVNKNYICSARDANAIRYIFSFHHIKINDEFIFAKRENGNVINRFSKYDQVNLILKKESFFDYEFTLIEDQLTLPLKLLKKFSKMKIIYAKYGYGIDEEWIKPKTFSFFSIEKDEELQDLVLN